MKIDPAGLNREKAHELLIGAVLPRPVALISTIGADGVHNLAPFSFYIPISMKPVLMGVAIARKADGSKKDTLVNIESGKDFVINLVTEEMAEAMNQTAGEYPSQVDEFKEAGLTPVPADLVKSPMVGESPVSMECRLAQILEFGEGAQRSYFIIGEVIRLHVQDQYWRNGAIDSAQLKVIGRLGGELYCRTTDVFEMKRPTI